MTEALLAIGWCGFLTTSLIAIKIHTSYCLIEIENIKLKRGVQDWRFAASQAANKIQALEKIKVIGYPDQKTVSLIRLAAGNSNENEARAAAMQVCKRLFKDLPK